MFLQFGPYCVSVCLSVLISMSVCPTVSDEAAGVWNRYTAERERRT